MADEERTDEEELSPEDRSLGNASRQFREQQQRNRRRRVVTTYTTFDR